MVPPLELQSVAWADSRWQARGGYKEAALFFRKKVNKGYTYI
jgi:hypothetical protein